MMNEYSDKDRKIMEEFRILREKKQQKLEDLYGKQREETNKMLFLPSSLRIQ